MEMIKGMVDLLTDLILMFPEFPLSYRESALYFVIHANAGIHYVFCNITPELYEDSNIFHYKQFIIPELLSFPRMRGVPFGSSKRQADLLVIMFLQSPKTLRIGILKQICADENV